MNEKIRQIFKQHNIPEGEGFLYLLGLNFHLNVDFERLFGPVLVKHINQIPELVEYNPKEKRLEVKLPLFIDTFDEEFENFIREYRLLFKSVLQKKAGSRKEVIRRMIQFLNNFPDYSYQDILQATEWWLTEFMQSGQNPYYLRSAEYFIYKTGPDGKRDWFLKDIIDDYKEQNQISNTEVL